MMRLFSLFTNRWVISAFGLTAVAFLIWTAGPLLSFAGYEPLALDWVRAALIGLVTALWVANVARREIQARRQNQQMLQGMAAQAEAPSPTAVQTGEEIAELQRRFDEAVGLLKKARLGGEGEKQYLHQLPWYVIIGPPGSGKTTALVNSGLHFPLAGAAGNQPKVKGVGGTRNCDWWFTDEAVLLDTAGRYTTQDSQAEVDRAAWLGFLGLLKKHRRRRPINGVLVAVSVADLMQQTETETAAHVRAIRQRVEELHKELGIRFPVYLLFTKCDLLAGFVEYFDDLGQDARAQVWGFTFPAETLESPGQALATYQAEFEALERRLAARVTERLQAERDAVRRERVYGFPQQFSSLRQATERFTAEVFRPSRFETPAMLRGVYFTSGTQEGAPVDRLMGTLAQTFGLAREAVARFSGTGRSYFLTRFFRDLVFGEAPLAGTDRAAERKRLWLQRAAYAGAIALTLLLGAGWLTSYYRNAAYVKEVSRITAETQKTLDRFAPGERDLLQILAPLNAARDLPGGYGHRGGTPFLMGLGLYQGHKLGSRARAAYRGTLRDLLLPALMLRIEDQLRQGQTNLEYLHEGLKVYLMLGDPDHYDPAAIKGWVHLDWQEQPRRFTTEQRTDLDGHLDALLEHYPDTLPIPLDTGLIARTRARVTQVPLAQRVYGRLKLSRTARELPELSVATAAGRDAALVFRRRSGEPLSRGVPGLYTLEGYRKAVEHQVPLVAKDLLAERWVLGPAEVALEPEKVLELVTGVQALYFADYIRQWDGLLKDLDLVAFANLRQAVDVTGVLSGKDSPLRRLFTTVARETTFEEPEAEKAGGEAGGGDALSAVKDKLSQMFQSTPAPVPSATPAAARATHPVDGHFAELHALVRDAGGGAPIDSVLAGLEELHVHVNSIASAMDRGGTALDAAQQGSVGGAAGKLKLQAKRQPPPLGAWVTDLAEGSSSLTLGNARGHVNSIWTSQVLPFCQRALGGRYPIARNSSQEVTLADFARLFGPGGLIDGFFQKYLAAFVDTSGRTWRWRSDGDVTLGSSAEALRQFQRAAEIRDAFFGGGATPTVSFQLRPISMDSAIERFSLDLDGQQLAYSHGPVRPTSVTWPGPGGAGQVTMEVSPPAAGGRSAIMLTGAWAVFRLFDRASIEPTAQPEEFRVTFDVGGRKAVYALTASSVVNPFRLPALHAFSCPERL